jgi:hypothetical protein
MRKQDFENIRNAATDAKTSIQEANIEMQKLAKQANDSSTAIQNSADITRELAKLSQELSGMGRDDLKNKNTVNKLERDRTKVLQNQRRLESKMLELRMRRINASKSEKKLIDQSLRALEFTKHQVESISEGYKDILDTSKEIEKSNPFKPLADIVGEIPVLRKVFGEFEKSSEAFRNSMADGESRLKSIGEGLKPLGSTIAKLTAGLAVKGLKDFDERSVSIARNMNTSREQANQLVKSANEAAKAIKGVTGADISAAQKEFSDALGTTAVLSDEIAANFSILTNKLGLSATEASELTKFSEALGQNSKTQTEELIAQTQILNAQTDSSIKYQEVVKDIASANKAILLSSRGNTQELSRASFEAKKFGLSLNQADSIAGSLLDFESSIAAELEAELLTGKQLNLERARQAALEGDLATLTSEIAKNVGSAEEFGRMNRIQQEAIAKSVGMTREELAASLVEQQALTKLGAKDKNELREKVKQRLAEVNVIKDIEKREEARSKLIKELGSDELVRQQENRSLQELQAEAAQKIIEAFDKLSVILAPIGKLFDGIAGNAGIVVNSLMAISGLSLVSKFKPLAKMFNGMFKSSKGILKNMTKTGGKGAGKVAGKGIGKMLGKGALKSAVKKVPILGALAGIGFAISRFKQGDVLGAGLELASGLASTIPGLGTAASAAIDVGLAAKDVSQSKSRSAPQTMDVDDFTIRTNPEDTITMAGGTKLGGNVETLLKELIVAVKEGGDVYIDGAKVGKSLALSTSRMG